ncbi:Cleavage stimulation factor subunit 2 tau variant, partial [Stegodyphus mimosarum]
MMPTNPTMTMPRPVTTQQSRPSLLGDRPAVIPAPPKPVLPNPVLPNTFPERAMDPRAMGDHDLRQPPVGDRDMRTLPMMTGDKDMRQQMGDQDLRTLGVPGGVQECRPYDPRFRGVPGLDVSTRGPPFDRPSVPATVDSRTSYEARPVPPSRMDTQRNVSMPAAPNIPNPRMPTNPRISAVSNGSPMVGGASPSNVVSSPRQPNALAAAAAAIAPHDQEKAALIMQVLQLSDQQIAMLPPEQRQSIMVLKEQIARSQQAS